MSVGIKADPSGTFGELLLGGSPVVRFDSGGLTTTTSGQDYYNQANILGVVSQSGGIPTGAIIERGSNANGEYVLYADGTQICTFTTASLALSISSGPNNGLFHADVTQTFPASFVNIAAISGVVRFTGFVIGLVGHDQSTIQWILFATSGTNIGAVTGGMLRLIAIGRWF